MFKMMIRKNNMAGIIRRILLTAVLLFPLISSMGQSTVEAAFGSPYGIFIITGKDLLATEKGREEQYLVERRGINENLWKEVATITSPDRAKEFEQRLKRWCDKFPEWADYNRIPVERLFVTLQRTGKLDSLGFYSQLLPVRLATGVMYLDSTVTDTLRYQYRVSKITAKGLPQILYAATAARMEETTFLGRPVIVRKVVSSREVIINSGLDPGFRPSFYRVFRKEEGAKAFSLIRPATVRYIKNDTAFVTVRDTAIRAGKVYDYYITPVDYYGRESVSSDIVRTGIYSFGSVRAPYSIKTSAVLPAGGIRLQWKMDTPGDIRSLNIYKSADYDTGYVLLARIAPADTGFTDVAAEPMRKYFYYFVMEGFFNEVSPPGVRVFGIAENKIPPFRPIISSSQAVINGARVEIKVFNPDIRAVRIYRRLRGAEEFSPVAVVPVKDGVQTVYTDTSMYFSGYTLLSYTALAENTSHALSEFSDTVSVFPISETKPYSPVNVSAAYENGSVNLIWDDMSRTNPEITGYRVYRKVIDAASVKQKDFTLLSDRFLQPEVNYFTDTVVVTGNTYEYLVRSVDFKGAESLEGTGAVITLQKATPVAPSAMKLYAQTDGIMIEWEEPDQEDIKSYRVYRYERGGKPTLVTTVSRGTERFNDITARKGKLYFYYLTSVHQNGNESVPGREEGIWK